MKMLDSTVRLLALIVPGLALVGCGEHDIPRGPLTSETREVDDFSEIALKGSAQLHIQVGEPASLFVEGSKEALRRLETEVHGDTLRIRTGPREWAMPGGSSRLVIKVTVPKLTDLRIEGGNDVRIEGFDGGETKIEIEGAAQLKATGRLDELVVRMEGAGHANLRNLVARDAEVTVDGVGSVYVNSTESLDARMNGVGAILYSGTPREVSTSMRGVGTISKDREREEEPKVERDERKEEIDTSKLQPEYEV
jgi:hypothetical protein